MIVIPQARTFDREAVLELVASWVERLPLDDMPDGGDDTVAAVNAAVNKVVDLADIKDMRPAAALSDSVIAGIDIALAILNDPLGDPRDEIMAALERLRAEVALEARDARADRTMERELRYER